MPQDELWAASARSIGFSLTFQRYPAGERMKDSLHLRPLWSKRPSGRDGSVWLDVPGYATWDVPVIFRAAFEQWLGGVPKDVPVVAGHALRAVLHEYQEGARS